MCLGTNMSGHKRVWSQTSVGTNVCLEQTCLGTIVCGHKRVRAQTCVGTNVCRHNRVWAQTFVGTIVSGHKRVWAQSCVDTNVSGHNRVGSSMYGYKRVVSIMNCRLVYDEINYSLCVIQLFVACYQLFVATFKQPKFQETLVGYCYRDATNRRKAIESICKIYWKGDLQN